MQTAAYVGFRARGVAGAAVSLLGLVFRLFLLMVALSAIYTRTNSLPAIAVRLSRTSGRCCGDRRDRDGLLRQNLLEDMAGDRRCEHRRWFVWLGINPIFVILLAAVLGIVLLERQSDLHLGSEQRKLHSCYNLRRDICGHRGSGFGVVADY